MSTVLVNDSYLYDIASAIRQKAGTSQTFKPSEMASAISDIPSGGSGGDTFGEIVTKTISGSYRNTDITSLSFSAFRNCTQLEQVDLSNMTTYNVNYGFESCSKLETAILPKMTIINSGCFKDCKNLKTVNCDAATIVGMSAFQSCISLQSISLPSLQSISNYGFSGCDALESVYLYGSTVAALGHSNVFTNCPIKQSFILNPPRYGSIYVPASLYDTYKKATNWTYYAARFVSV